MIQLITLLNFQSSGNRYYLDGSATLKLDLVKQLKKMNETYPTSTVDYDFVFLFPLLRSIFKTGELKQCAKSGQIKHLNREKLKFAKGKCHS